MQKRGKTFTLKFLKGEVRFVTIRSAKDVNLDEAFCLFNRWELWKRVWKQSLFSQFLVPFNVTVDINCYELSGNLRLELASTQIIQIRCLVASDSIGHLNLAWIQPPWLSGIICPLSQISILWQKDVPDAVIRLRLSLQRHSLTGLLTHSTGLNSTRWRAVCIGLPSNPLYHLLACVSGVVSWDFIMGRGREKSVILPNVHHGGPPPWLMMFFLTDGCVWNDFCMHGSSRVYNRRGHVLFKGVRAERVSKWPVVGFSDLALFFFKLWNVKIRFITFETNCWFCRNDK